MNEEQRRELIAVANNFVQYRCYTEQEAAGFIRTHYRTLGKWRRAGLLDCIRGNRVPREDTSWMGYEIADIILGKHRNQRRPNDPTVVGVAP